MITYVDDYSLCSHSTHVDEYGFSHEHSTDGMVLHYAAQQLVKHYSRCLQPYEQHQRAWCSILEPLTGEQPLLKCVRTICVRVVCPTAAGGREYTTGLKKRDQRGIKTANRNFT